MQWKFAFTNIFFKLKPTNKKHTEDTIQYNTIVKEQIHADFFLGFNQTWKSEDEKQAEIALNWFGSQIS